jgi:heme exporter protein A
VAAHPPPVNAIEASRVHHRYGSLLALRPLDLVVPRGERVAVLGGNGAGKSTLLRLLAGVSLATGGEIRILGLSPRRDRLRLRSAVGYLSHQPGLYPQLTALENLQFFCGLHGLPREQALVALQRVDLESSAYRRTCDLSRGLQQRLALARSVLHDPHLLVLDEPDASLDAAGRSLLSDLAYGRTLILATHDHELARSCDRRLHLLNGRLETAAKAGLEVVG